VVNRRAFVDMEVSCIDAGDRNARHKHGRPIATNESAGA